MPGAAKIATDDLKPGDVLAQDVMVGHMVLLRAGTVLQTGQIDRIRKLHLTSIDVKRKPDKPAYKVPDSKEPLPDFKSLEDEETTSWLATEHFHQSVPKPDNITDNEQLFAEIKDKVRSEAGLTPAIEPDVDKALQKEIHSAYISSALKKTVQLEKLSSAASKLSQSLLKNPSGYLEFKDATQSSYLDFHDTTQYGQYLAARTIMSCKIFYRTRENTENDLAEELRGQLALSNARALLPTGALDDIPSKSPVERAAASEALLEYYQWLRNLEFVNSEILDLMLLQFERLDGEGIPYGHKGEDIPAESESWAVVNTYTERLFSRPKHPRISGREAADFLVAQAGTAFSSNGVNKFLRVQGYFPNGSMVELSDGRKALVVAQDQNALLKPRVRLINTDGSTGDLVDLSQLSGLFIRTHVLEY